MPRKKLLGLAGGRVWSGAQAREAGLVDRLGGLYQAIAEAAGDAGLEKGSYKVEHQPAPRNPLDFLSSGLQGSRLRQQLPAALGLLPATVRRLAAPTIRMILHSLEDGPRARVWAMLPGNLRLQ